MVQKARFKKNIYSIYKFIFLTNLTERLNFFDPIIKRSFRTCVDIKVLKNISIIIVPALTLQI